MWQQKRSWRTAFSNSCAHGLGCVVLCFDLGSKHVTTKHTEGRSVCITIRKYCWLGITVKNPPEYYGRTRPHDDVIKWKHFPRYWPFVRNSPHKGTKASDAELWCFLRLNKRLRKQSWGCWFETLSCPLWRHCNDSHGGCSHSIGHIGWTGSRLSIKIVFPRYGDSHVKDKTVARPFYRCDRLIFNMGILILARHLYTETAPRFLEGFQHSTPYHMQIQIFHYIS